MRSIKRRLSGFVLTTLLLVCGVAHAGDASFARSAAKGQDAEPLDLDPAFGVDGAADVPISARAYATAGFAAAGGELIVFGFSDNNNASLGEGIYLRLAPDGTQLALQRYPSAGFGCNAPRNFLAATRAADGDYLVGGYVQTNCSGIPRFFDVRRLAPDAQSGFPFEVVPFNNQLAYVFGLAEQADGKVVAVGLVSGDGFLAESFDIGVARFLPDGTLDATFANGGTFTFDLEGARDQAADVLVDPTGRILVAARGVSMTTDRDILVLALDDAGGLDPTFGEGGIFRYDRAGALDTASAMVQLESGRIIVSGATSPGVDVREFSAIGITADGELDTDFGTNGLTVVDFGATTAGVGDLTVGPTGRVYLVGSAEVEGTEPPVRVGAIAVLLPDGRMDPSFNGGLGRTFTFGGLASDLPASIDVDALGSRILIAGSTQSADTAVRNFAVARLIGLDPFLFSNSFEADEGSGPVP